MAENQIVDRPLGQISKNLKYFSGPRVLSSNETKAQVRNKFEVSRLSIRLKQIDKEIEVNDQSRSKELKKIRESMRIVRESTGCTEQPEALKSTKNITIADDDQKNKTTRSGSTNSYMFNYELIKEQAEENYGMLYNAFSIKSLQDPIYQYNPTFLRIKDNSNNNSSEQNSGQSSRLSLHDDVDNNGNEKGQNIENSMINEGDITFRKGGFKMTFDESEDEEENDAQVLDKYKSELKKFEDDVIIQVPLEDDKLEQIYDDLVKAKASIPSITKEKINGLKHKDPVFAKRYKQFASARQSGKVPIYENEHIPVRLAMPRSAIEKRKKEMMQSLEEKSMLKENPYASEQLKLSEKVTNFVKNLSVNT